MDPGEPSLTYDWYTAEVVDRIEARARLTRRLPWFAGVAALLAIPMAGLAYVTNFQPLSRGMVSWSSGVPTSCPVTFEQLSPLRGQGFEREMVECTKDGQLARWGTSLQNNGPLSIRITRIDAFPLQFLTDSEIRYGTLLTKEGADPSPDPNNWETLWPMRPFTIHPDETYRVFFTARMKDCGHFGMASAWLHVTYTVIGVHRAELIPIQIGIACRRAA